MSRRSRVSSAAPGRRGFTLMEAMVSLIILVVVMVVVLSLLFQMKSFAEKQQAFTAPRQTARRALDYVAGILQGATDLNQMAGIGNVRTSGNPFALVMFWEWGSNTTSGTDRRQATYNNLTGSETGNGTFIVNPLAPAAYKVTSTNFGSAGTDIISAAFPSSQTNPVKIPVSSWPDVSPAGTSIALDFSAGCGGETKDDTANLLAFRTLVGAVAEPGNGGRLVSSVLIVADNVGRWRLVQLWLDDASVTSACAEQTTIAASGNGRVIAATLKAGTDVQYYAPGGWRGDIAPAAAFLLAGFDFVSFRHRTVLDPTDPAGIRVVGQIEQKSSGLNPSTGLYVPGFFDPILDASLATTGFTPIVENVDDFQVAYVLRDGSIWNTATQTFNNGGTRIPFQAQTPADPASGVAAIDCTGTTLSAANLDAACVVGLRVTVVGRSQPLTIGSRTLGESALNRRPAAEDHAGAAGPDVLSTGIFDRRALTTTFLIRNRALGY